MFRRQVYYYASVVFLVVWIVYTVSVINRPYVGLELEHVNEQWIVTYSDPQGEGYKAGIRVGDLIIKINQRDPGTNRFVQIWSEAEGASTLEVRKLDQKNDQIINIPVLPLQNGLSSFPLVILGFVFWLLGFLTWFKRPLLVQARSFFWLNWFIGLALVVSPASSRDLLLARESESIFFSAVPIFLINFASVFPTKKKRRINQLGSLIVTLLFAVILTITVLQSIGIVHDYSLLKKLVLSTMSIGIFIVLENLSVSLKAPKDKPENNQAVLLLLSIILGFTPFILLTDIPMIFGFQLIVDAHISTLFISVIPAFWYYVIVNKYLPDSRRIFGKVISYFFAGIIMSLAAFCLLFFAGVLKDLSFGALLDWFSLTIMVMVGFNLICLLMSKLFNKFGLLTGEQALSQRVLKLNERLTSLREGEGVLEEVVNCLGIEGAFIVAENANGTYLKKAAGGFEGNPDEQAELETYFQTDQRNNLGAKKLSDDFPAEFYIFLEYNDFNCGIFLGHRLSYTKLQEEDLPLITLISNQAAQRYLTTYIIKELSQEIQEISQKSLNHQRKIQRMRRITGSLFKSIEQERKSIARDIHDGPLQLALDLNRWLDEIAEECPSAENSKSFQAISRQREIIRNLNFELRSICSDLRPPSLSDLGLFSAIESLCEETMQNGSILISLEMAGFNEEISLREEIEITAYRFIQEGIANTVKHSGSSEIMIKIELDDSKLELSIRDYGKGFDIGKIDDVPLTSDHFGLIGMKERLQNIGGELQINSLITQGTTLKASIPIKKGER